jgi:hypothetical protein
MDDIMTPRVRVSERFADCLNFLSRATASFLTTLAHKVRSHHITLTSFDDYTPEIQFAVIINEHGTHAPPNDLDTNSQLSHRHDGALADLFSSSSLYAKAL